MTRKTLVFWMLAVPAVAIIVLVSTVTAKDSPRLNLRTVAITSALYTGTFSWNAYPVDGQAHATIIGIHGTPGDWSAWDKLSAQPGIRGVQFLAIDRPGWGLSNNNSNDVITSLNDQADIIALGLKDETLIHPVVLVAHSWGGPVALALAARHPNLVDGLILLASPADPKHMRPRWYHKLAKSRLTQWVIGNSMSRSNIEMLALPDELDQLTKTLSSIRQPTYIMHGRKDFLVPAENAFYLQRQLKSASVKLAYDMDGNHFIPFSDVEKVIPSINWVLEKALFQHETNKQGISQQAHTGE